MIDLIIPRGKQREVIELPIRGHNVVLGVAGSGKSVCALQRAKYIRNTNINSQVSNLFSPNPHINNNILVLSYNKTLATYLSEMSREQDSFAKIEVKTYHSFATKQMRARALLDDNLGILESSLTQKEIKRREKKGENSDTKESLIKKAIEFIKAEESSQGNEISTLNRTEFIIDEITWFQRVGALSFEEYYSIERTGRGRGGLARDHRRYIFKVYEKYVELREQSGCRYDWDDISYYFNRDLVENPNLFQEYKHIIIDEGQDFSATMIRSLVSYLGNDGSIMFFSDSAQQIYGNSRTPWKNVGLKINKTYTLDENFRNTKQIESLAKAIKEKIGLEVEEKTDSIYNSNEGQLPEVVGFNLQEGEMTYVKNKAAEFARYGSVAVMFPTNESAQTFFYSLSCLTNVEKTHVTRESKYIRNKNGILVGTYQAFKGMEFDSVIIPYCTDAHLILEKRLSALDSLEEADSEVARLLYVALTRAKKNLLITYSGALTRVFPENNNLFHSKNMQTISGINEEEDPVNTFDGTISVYDRSQGLINDHEGDYIENPNGDVVHIMGYHSPEDDPTYYPYSQEDFFIDVPNNQENWISSFADVATVNGPKYYVDEMGRLLTENFDENMYSTEPLFNGDHTGEDGSDYYPEYYGEFNME